MRVLETMTSDLGVAPDLGTYNTAISALGRTRNMATARYLVEHRFPLLGLKPNVFTFNALIHACGVVGNAHAAFELMHRMRGAAVMPNQVTFSTLLEQCVRAREPELVAHVLADMERTRGVTLDSKSVSSLLEMFRARRDAPSAIAAVQRAVREGGAAALDTAAFNALVTICLDWGARDHAVGVVGMLLAAGRADAGTFNAVIERSGVREKNPARAAEVFSAMKARGVAPNDVTYSTMIRACAQNGQLERAFRLLAEMQDVGLGASDTYAWTAVIDGCGRSGQGSRAVEILDYMRGGGGAASSSAPGLALHGLVPAPNTATYNAALYAAGVGGGGWPAAWRVYELMRADSGAQPDHITYSSLASALLDNRQVVCDVAQVEAVAAGLREAAARVQREKPASKGATRSKAQTLKRIAAKVSRVDWLAETLRRGSGADDGAVGRRAVSVAQTERCDGDREESVAESVGD
jgi:pentatricopeptide repeat protein